MAIQPLAVKYRPKTFDDVSEQSAVKTILTQQIATHTIKNTYLFCGGAGTGKTTCARIFANEINGGLGNPIEIDGASNNSVDNVREIIRQAQTKSLDSEYKVFIIDECHALSNSAWQSFLKLIEEPPAKSVFIFATTDPQKIPKTILSRVQRYDFQRISQQGISNRLHTIMVAEELAPIPANTYDDALDYIAKIADGGMRDAITLLDKCLAYSTNITMENITAALGISNYDTMMNLTDSILTKKSSEVMIIIDNIYSAGKDLKQFIKSYLGFVLDINKVLAFGSIDNAQRFVKIPYTDETVKWLNTLLKSDCDNQLLHLLDVMVKLNADIKWETAPKTLIEAVLFGETI